jgi:hypothetical protein
MPVLSETLINARVIFAMFFCSFFSIDDDCLSFKRPYEVAIKR